MNTKIIKLDINRRLYDKIVAKQDDTKSRFLLFQLLDGAVPFNLTDRSVRVYGVKPDGSVVFNDLTVTHSTTGFCLLELTNQMLAIAGIVKLELMITEGDKKLTSIPFDMEVIKKINSNAAVESSNEFGALLTALKEIDQWNREFADKSGKLEELYTPRLNELSSQLETKANLVEEKEAEYTSYTTPFLRWVDENNKWYGYRIPNVIKTKTGRILAVADCRYTNMDDLGSDSFIVCNYSDDKGRTWLSKARTVIDKGVRGTRNNGCGDPSVVQDLETGEIFVFCLYWKEDSMAVNNTNPDNPAYDFIYCKSNDDGETWSETVSIKSLKESSWHLLFNSPNPGFYSNGILYVPAQFWDSNHIPHSTYIYSDDHGVTWKKSEVYLPNSTTECCVNKNPLDEIVINARSNNRYNRTIAKKYKDGYVFIVGQNIADPICNACITQGDNGIYYMTHQNSISTRNRLCVSYSRDCENWTMLAIINTDTTTGYSSVVDCGEELMILYEYGMGYIRCKTYNKKNLFSTKNKMLFYDRSNNKQIDIPVNTKHEIYLEPETQIVYLNNSVDISKIYGFHNQEIKIMNISTSEKINFLLSGVISDSIKKDYYLNTLTLYPNESVTLLRYSNIWRIIDLKKNILEDYIINEFSEETPISEYPFGKSTFYTNTNWTLGKGVVETVKIGSSPLYYYQLFNVHGKYDLYKRVCGQAGNWTDWKKININV